MSAQSPINDAARQTRVWLKELQKEAGLTDEAAALGVLRAVLHQLRDRLTVEEAVDLAQQLPIVVRGIYFEGWQPKHVPQKIHTRQKFFDQITLKLLPRRTPPASAVESVFALIAHHCDPGEISDVISQMPRGLQELWPEAAREFKQKTRAEKKALGKTRT
jgi:uncharacterized protein (DUF2267 family)